MTKTKTKSPEETKERILNAARLLFVKKGYFNTSIPDIVQESGISIGSLYHHFKNKQYLAKYLYEETMKSVVTELENKISTHANLKDKLKSVVSYILELADKNQIKLEYMLFIKHEEIQEQFIPICLSRPFTVVKELLDQGKNAGELNDAPLDIMAAGFMGIPLKIIEMKINKVIDYPLESRLDIIFQMCWKSITK